MNKRAGELSTAELDNLMTVVANPRQFKVPDWFLNRQKDYKDGRFSQVVSNQLDMKLRDDLERLKKIRTAKMFTALRKIQKDKGVEPTSFEEDVAQAFFDLENTKELQSDLKDLFINSAVQVDISNNRKAVVIHVPYRLRKSFRKAHPKLVRELEKKFSGKDVVLIATRRIVRPPKKGAAVRRPRSRTLTSVHDNILEDVVQPAEIVGKRCRYRLDGSKVMKVFLDPKSKNDTEYKLETFSGVYRKLCGKDVVFEYAASES